MNWRRNFFLNAVWLTAGVSFAISFYALFLRQAEFYGWISWGILFLFSIAGFYLSRFLTMKFLLPFWDRVSLLQKILGIIAAIGFSFWLIIAIPLRPEWIAFFFPKHELTITPFRQTSLSGSSGILWVESLSDGNRYLIPYHQFHGEGWIHNDEGWVARSDSAGSLLWRGRLLNRGYLVFRASPEGGQALVEWDGQKREVSLFSPEVSQVVVKLDNPQPFTRYLSWLALGAYWISLSWGILSLIGHATLFHRISSFTPTPLRSWIGYSIPPLLSGCIYWLTFYPAILSEDSIDQWRQVLTGQFNDWAPAIYTLITAGMSKIWNTPASMAVLQAVLFSLLVGWGIGQFRSLGLPAKAGWGISFLMAVIPANPVLAITHWKDIPYSYGLAGLFILCLLIAETEGKWLTEKYHWLGFSLMAVVVFLFRHNGIAIISMVFVLLFVLYRNSWKYLGLALLGVLGIGLGIRGPLYHFLGVERNSYILGDTIFLHHFGAHITGGTPLTEEEKAYFNSLTPLDSWPYYCCNVSPIYFTDRFNHQLFAENHSRHLSLFLQLALRNPRVELQHWICSSGLVWRVCLECTTLYHNIEMDNYGNVRWINENPFGVKEQSLVPSLVKPLSRWVIWSSTHGAGIFWSVGGALYVFLVIWGITALQRRSWKWALQVGAVPVLQSLIMAVVNISSDFRYQYGVFLIALFSLGLIGSGRAADSVQKPLDD